MVEGLTAHERRNLYFIWDNRFNLGDHLAWDHVSAGQFGADRAAYATMLFPIVALGISTVYEGYRWSEHNLIGMVLVLIGNGLVINKKAFQKG
jgi:hypothetical protein